MIFADTIFCHGTILTQDLANLSARAVAVRNGKIIAVSNSDELDHLKGPDTRMVNLEGQTLLPGFNDSHVHVWKVGHLLTSLLDLRGIRSKGELLMKLRDFAASRPDDLWVMARGYNESLWEDSTHPTAEDIDSVIPDRPVYLIRTCAHVAVTNSLGMKLAGINRNTPAPPGGEVIRKENGDPIGRVTETALGLVTQVMPSMTVADYKATILAGCRHQLSLGITSATDPAVTPELIQAYRELDASDELPNRMNLLSIRRPDGGAATYPLPEKVLTERLRIDGVKFFADGGLSGATAALKGTYKHQPTSGVLRFETEELYELAYESAANGFRIGTHAIGDAAIEQVLDVYKRVASSTSCKRHRIEHCGIPWEEHLEEIANQKIIVATQPTFLHDLGGNFSRYLNEDYLNRIYPYKSMLDHGVLVAFSSDAPVVRNDHPLLGIQSAITRASSAGDVLQIEESLTLTECLYAYTMAGAYASGDEANRGSIKEEKWADFVVLDRDITQVPIWELSGVKVLQTWLSGDLVFQA